MSGLRGAGATRLAEEVQGPLFAPRDVLSLARCLVGVALLEEVAEAVHGGEELPSNKVADAAAGGDGCGARRSCRSSWCRACPRPWWWWRWFWSGGDQGFQRDARARSLHCASAPRPSTRAPCCSALAPMASLTRDRPPCWGAVAV